MKKEISTAQARKMAKRCWTWALRNGYSADMICNADSEIVNVIIKHGHDEELPRPGEFKDYYRRTDKYLTPSGKPAYAKTIYKFQK